MKPVEELQFIQQEIARLEKRLRDLRDKVLHPLSEAIEPQKDILAIQRIVAEFFGLSVEDLSSGSRFARISQPRHIAITLCREQTTHSNDAIAKAFCKTRCTVFNAMSVVDFRRKTEAKYAERYKQIEHLVLLSIRPLSVSVAA